MSGRSGRLLLVYSQHSQQGRNNSGTHFLSMLDMTPGPGLQVRFQESRVSFLSFLTSLCAIIGGVFTGAAGTPAHRHMSSLPLRCTASTCVMWCIPCCRPCARCGSEPVKGGPRLPPCVDLHPYMPTSSPSPLLLCSERHH